MFVCVCFYLCVCAFESLRVREFRADRNNMDTIYETSLVSTKPQGGVLKITEAKIWLNEEI